MVPGGSSVPPTRGDLRKVEARLDARLQEINARLMLHDGRFAAMGDHINQADRRSDALSARVDARLRSMDRRFDTIESRLDVLTPARCDRARLRRDQRSNRHGLVAEAASS